MVSAASTAALSCCKPVAKVSTAGTPQDRASSSQVPKTARGLAVSMADEAWPFRKVGATGQLNGQELIAAASRCLENTMPQQVKSGTSAHGALDCLQVAD